MPDRVLNDDQEHPGLADADGVEIRLIRGTWPRDGPAGDLQNLHLDGGQRGRRR